MISSRTRPIRVAILIDSLIAGGAERVAVEAAARLDRTRFAPRLLVTRGGGPLEPIAVDASVPIAYLDRRSRFEVRGLRRALAVVRSSDLLHAHKYAGSMFGAGLARLAGRPLVAHEHTFAGVRSWSRTIAYRHWIAPVATRVICVSEFVAASLRDEGLDPRLLAVVPNGVPIDAALSRELARAELGLPPEGQILGMVGRLRPEKRHDLALEALRLLRADGADLTLCVIGDGPLRADLEALAATLGISDAVLWAGEREAAGRLVRAFDLTLMPSTFEGMPLAVLESLVAGVPVVATNVGGLPELIQPGFGLLVPAGDASALARAIGEAHGAFGRTSGIPHAQVEAARSSFSVERMVRHYEEIYEQAVASGATGGGQATVHRRRSSAPGFP